MAAHTSMLHVRIDDETKAQATQTLAAMGLSVSDAVRLFLHRVVVDQAFPLELKVPNAETRKAMAEADEIISTRHARFSTAAELFDDLEKKNRQVKERRCHGRRITQKASSKTGSDCLDLVGTI